MLQLRAEVAALRAERIGAAGGQVRCQAVIFSSSVGLINCSGGWAVAVRMLATAVGDATRSAWTGIALSPGRHVALADPSCIVAA